MQAQRTPSLGQQKVFWASEGTFTGKAPQIELLRCYNFQNFLVVPCIHFLLSVELERCLADVAFFPSSIPTPAFQHSRNFWAKLFPRPLLTQSEGSGVQTSWALPFSVSILGLSDVMACELTSSIFAKYKWSTNYWRWQRPWSDEGINMGMIGFTKMP